MEVRPPAAVTFLAQNTELLSHGNARTRLDRGIDRLKVAVAVIPALVIEHVDDIVARLGGSFLVARQAMPSGRDDQPGCRSDHVNQALGPADIEAAILVSAD
jgi:hypothetical protein